MINLSELDSFKRRHLPHIDRPGAPTFVTFRLFGSLSRETLKLLMDESNRWSLMYGDLPEAQTLVHKRVFARLEKFLEGSILSQKGPLYLADSALAGILEKNLIWGVTNSRYLLHAWCIMPNHVHVLLETLPREYKLENQGISWQASINRREEVETLHRSGDRQECLSYQYWPLAKVLQGLKGVSANEINKARGAAGRVWQEESFDHIVRDEAEYYRVLRYIEMNPVSAKITTMPGKHRFTQVLTAIPDKFNL